MFDENKVKVGDILQHSKGKKNDFMGYFINFFTLGDDKKDVDHCHTARYMGMIDGKHWKAEAHMGTTYGLVQIQDKELSKIDIYRLKVFPNGLTAEQTVIYKRVTGRFYGRKYDTLGLVGTIRSAIGKLLGWGGLRKSNPWLNNSKSLFCSEAESTIWTQTCTELDWLWEKVDVAPLVWDKATTPNDITRSDSVFKVA